MKIALYGMPCAGKSTLMDRITDAKIINGSQELKRNYKPRLLTNLKLQR